MVGLDSGGLNRFNTRLSQHGLRMKALLQSLFKGTH